MIISTEPNVQLTGRYNVMETCKILCIHRNTLHKYTEQGLIRCGFRRANSRKFFTGAEILCFWRATL